MDYCDLGFEIEMPIRMAVLLIIFLLTIAILTFIIELKIIKLRREEAKRNKPKEDELQKLLNAVNDKIISLSNIAEQDSKELQTRKCDFGYFKGMILGLMEERKNKNDN